jgi:hypothetical protein
MRMIRKSFAVAFGLMMAIGGSLVAGAGPAAASCSTVSGATTCSASIGLSDSRIDSYVVPFDGTTGSDVTADTSLNIQQSWSFIVDNNGPGPVGSAAFNATSTRTFYSSPGVSTSPPPPYSGSASPLATDTVLRTSPALEAAYALGTEAPGFSSTRTVSPLVIPPGGTTQTMTAEFTFDNLPAGYSNSMGFVLDGDVGSVSGSSWTFTGSSDPTDTVVNEEGPGEQNNVVINNLVVGTTYTLTFSGTIPNTSGQPFAYKPRLLFYAAEDGPVGEVFASSYSTCDPVLEGTPTCASWNNVTYTFDDNYQLFPSMNNAFGVDYLGGTASTATVSGTVTDPAGNAFPSPIVSGVVACPTGETLSPSCPGGAMVTADPSGFYSTNLAPGSYNVVGLSYDPSYPAFPGVSAVVTLTLGAGDTVTQDFVVPYPPTATVSGTATGPGGTSLPGGTSNGVPVSGVFACPVGETMAANCAGIAATGLGSGGAYSLGLAPGEWNIAGYSGYGSSQVEVSPAIELTVAAGDTYTENFIVPQPDVSGTATGPGGTSLPGGTSNGVPVSGVFACPVGENLVASCAGIAFSGLGSGGAYSLSLDPGEWNIAAYSGFGSSQVEVSPSVELNVVAGDTYTENFIVAAVQTIKVTSSPPSPATVGATYQINATGGASGEPLVYSVDSSSTSGACSVSASSGLVSFTGAGTCVIDVNQAGNANYLAAVQVQQSLTVTWPAACVSISTVGTSVTTITGTYSGNYVVANGTTLYLKGGTITGNVTVDATGSLFAQGGTVDGNVQSSGGPVSLQGTTVDGNVQTTNAALALGPSTHVKGNVQVTGGTTFCSSGNTQQGSVQISGNLQVESLGATSNSATICDTAVSGNLQYQSNAAPGVFGGSLACSGDTVGGNLQVEDNTAKVTIGGTGYGNTVKGNIQVSSNTGGGTLTDNNAGGNIQLGSDKPGIVGSGNVAKGTNTGNATA